MDNIDFWIVIYNGSFGNEIQIKKSAATQDPTLSIHKHKHNKYAFQWDAYRPFVDRIP